MYIQSISQGNDRGKKLRDAFLMQAGLTADEDWEQAVLLWEKDTLIATGSRQKNILKCIAVDPAYQGEGLVATVLTALRQEAFRQGFRHLFLYTKPENEHLFRPLLFYPVVQTDRVLFMEDRKNGIRDFLSKLPVTPSSGPVGAAVMNCDPFTLGHRHLIETAAAQCDRLYVFVLSEDGGRFSPPDRMEMVKQGTAHLSNVTVLPTGPYLISRATFPTYFLKDREPADQIQCMLDIEIFCSHFAPKFGISRRYIGTEPLCPVTNQYNQTLAAHLPGRGIDVRQIPRLEEAGVPISASAVRALLDRGNPHSLESFVPATTLAYLKSNHLLS